MFPSTGETFVTWAIGGAARFYWSELVSTAIDMGWNRPARRDFSYPPPLTTPRADFPFLPSAVVGRATQRGGWTLSVGPAAELATRGRWRPWVGAELVVDRVVETYRQTSIVYAETIRESLVGEKRSETVVAAAAVAGLKVIAGRRLFLAADGALRRTLTDHALDFAPFRLRVSVGVR